MNKKGSFERPFFILKQYLIQLTDTLFLPHFVFDSLCSFSIFIMNKENELAVELDEVQKKRLEHDTINDLKDSLKERFDEILETIDSRESLLDEFDEQIFNALVEKIEVLTPTHFVFILKSGMRVEETVD